MPESINASRGSEKKVFTRDAWNLLPDHKYGWKQDTEEPEEVKNLKNQNTGENVATDNTAATGSDTGTGNTEVTTNTESNVASNTVDGGNTGGAGDAGAGNAQTSEVGDVADANVGNTESGNEENPEPQKLNAAELASKILAAGTVGEIEALLPKGEKRKTVLEAAKSRKKQLHDK